LTYCASNFDHRPFTNVIFPEFTVSWQFHSGALPGRSKGGGLSPQQAVRRLLMAIAFQAFVDESISVLVSVEI
jgi:hypothetical protein